MTKSVWTICIVFVAGMLMPAFLSLAQTNSRVSAFVITTSDPYITSDANNLDKQWYLPKIHALEAWDYVHGSSNVVVAIVDTGIHAAHIELDDGRVIEGYNAITNKTIPANSNSDDNGHGTAVSGIIGAISNNFKGIAGINWNIKLMPIKVLGADGSGDLNDVAEGLIWATDHGANIINLSMGGPGFGADMTLSNAISYAYEHGVLIVAAAGNDLAEQGQNLDATPIYPVCGDNGKNMILGVAATNIEDKKARFSNFGALCVDISAPGEHILTTTYLPSDPSNNILIYGSGTSLATPIVAGVAALIKAQNPNLSNTDLRNTIIKTADNIYPFNQTSCLGGSCNGFLGSGRVNALSAVSPRPVIEGSLVREQATGNIYQVQGGTKHLVTNFVFNQRGLLSDSIINETNGQLTLIPLGLPLMPLEGTLIKAQNDPTVYIINQNLKRPLTFLVFTSRKLSFKDVVTVLDTEVAVYPTGDWYWPPDGTLVVISGNPLVYVMDEGVARPVTYFVFTQRKLSFGKVIKVSIDDFIHVPKPQDLYWEPPLERTLVKSTTDAGIYIIENRTKRLLSLQAFLSRGYSFKNVKALPQPEIDVIAPGAAVL